MLNYIAALLTLSTKDFFSHLFTMQPDDMVICSLNERKAFRLVRKQA